MVAKCTCCQIADICGLLVLDILRKLGGDSNPGPKEVVHFDAIRPLLHELRQWLGNVG